MMSVRAAVSCAVRAGLLDACRRPHVVVVVLHPTCYDESPVPHCCLQDKLFTGTRTGALLNTTCAILVEVL